MQKPIKPNKSSTTKYACYFEETVEELFDKYGGNATLSIDYDGTIDIEYYLSDEEVEQKYQENLKIYELKMKEYEIWLKNNQTLLAEETKLKQQLHKIQNQLR